MNSLRNGSKAAKVMLFGIILMSLVVTRTIPVTSVQYTGVTVAHADDNSKVSDGDSHDDSSNNGTSTVITSNDHHDDGDDEHDACGSDDDSKDSDGGSQGGGSWNSALSTTSRDHNDDSDGGDDDGVCPPNPTPTSTVPVADISIVKTANVTSTNEGGAINYMLIVQNLGPATSTGVVATDVFPAGLTLVNATASVGTFVSSTGIWTIGNIAGNGAASLIIAATANAGTAGTIISNKATVVESASSTDPNLGNNSSTVSVAILTSGGGNPNPGAITVCKAIENASGTIVDGSSVSGQTFSVAGISTVPSTTAAAAGTLSTTNFTAPLTLNTKLFGSATNNAQCVTYSNLALGHWYYGQESLASSSQWAAPKYNDQDTVTASATSSMFSYSGELFDTNAANDASRNTNADGDIFLTASRPVRQLIVLNQLLGAPVTPPCGTDGDHNGPDGDGDADDLCVPPTPTSTVPVADISIVKTADIASTTGGGTINYTLTVQALGPATSTGVVAHDGLPEGLSFVSATSSVGSFASSTGIWTIGDLSASSTATLTIAATANEGVEGTTVSNTATVAESASSTDPNLSNNSSTASVAILGNGGSCTTNCGGGACDGDNDADDALCVTPTSTVPQADISITKTANVTSTTEGGTINYTLTVQALGPATSTGVVATDVLPSGLTYVTQAITAGTYSSSTGVWTIGDLPASSTATLMIAATANAGTAGTTILNTAVVDENASTTDPNPHNNSSTVPVIIVPSGCQTNCGGGGGGNGNPVADISVTKTVDNASPNPGDTITYTVTVSALGPTTSTNVVAHDVLPLTQLSFSSATTSQGAWNMTTGDWTIGTLSASSSATLVIQAVVAGNTAGDTITNTATVSELSSLVDPNTANNSASVSLTVASAPVTPPPPPPTPVCTPPNCPIVTIGGGGGTPITPPPPPPTPTPTPPPGQVLGASCGLYLTTYIHPVRKDLNDPSEVKKLQIFLNKNLGLNLTVSGDYDAATIAAVNQFQTKYHIEVLAPWVSHGLQSEFTPTSYVYKTTQRWINLIECSDLNLPLPSLP